MFFQLFLSVLSLNLLACKKTNVISLSKKEANFILKFLNSSIESKKKDVHEKGEDYSDSVILNGMYNVS